MRKFEWATVEYEGDQYDVCVAMKVGEVEEVRAVDSEINITPVMRNDVIDWMLDQAMTEIHWGDGELGFVDMNAKERMIEGY